MPLWWDRTTHVIRKKAVGDAEMEEDGGRDCYESISPRWKGSDPKLSV